MVWTVLAIWEYIQLNIFDYLDVSLLNSKSLFNVLFDTNIQPFLIVEPSYQHLNVLVVPLCPKSS